MNKDPAAPQADPVERPDGAIDALTNYQQQADMHGVMVTVSRQALDETLAYAATLETRLPSTRRHQEGGMNDLQLDRLWVEKKDGLFWVADWVSGPYGSTTNNRYHLGFRSKRDAESFVRAAKRAVKEPR